MSRGRRAFELALGAATLVPVPVFVAGVAVLIAAPPADGEFPLVPALLMGLWTVVNFVPAIVLAVDAAGDPSLGDGERTTWAVALIVLGGFVTPVYFWTRRWPRVTRTR